MAAGREGAGYFEHAHKGALADEGGDEEAGAQPGRRWAVGGLRRGNRKVMEGVLEVEHGQEPALPEWSLPLCHGA
ncbi:hypothetical protein SHIRM173S_02925 [Streptomyces hirsutus]